MGFRLYGALTQAGLSAAKCANQSKRLVASSRGLPAMVVPMTTSIVQPRRETNREVNSNNVVLFARRTTGFGTPAAVRQRLSSGQPAIAPKLFQVL
jgi:hypothetical protein